MRQVTFHFIGAGGSIRHAGEDAHLAAAILANCLSRQGYRSAALGHTVQVEAPSRRDSESEQIYVMLDEQPMSDADLLKQIDRTTTVVIGSARPARILRHELGRFAAGIASVDASGIAMEEGSDPVAALLGGAARIVPFIDPDVLCAAIWSTFDREFGYGARAAMRAFDLGYMQAQQALG